MTGRIARLMPSPTPGRIEELEGLVRRILADLEAGRDCDALIARIDAEAGSPGYDRSTFENLHGWTSPREFAERAALGRPPAIPQMSEFEIVACLRIVASGQEPQVGFYLGVLENSFPYVPISDLIFHPDEESPPAELAAKIVRLAQGSGPILL